MPKVFSSIYRPRWFIERLAPVGRIISVKRKQISERCFSKSPMTLLEKFSSVSFKGPGFDQIRFAAAMLVVAHHSWWGVHDLLYWYSKKFVHFGLLAVIVFFCISGFLVAPGLVRFRDVIRFGVHRSLRIFPALIVVVFASMFVLGPIVTTESLTNYFSDPLLYLYAKNAATLMAHYLPGVTEDGQPLVINGALWTLNIEVYSYIGLAVLSLVGALKRRIFALSIFIVTYVIYGITSLDSIFSVILPDRVTNFISLFVYFIAATNLFLYGDRVPFSAVLAASAFVAVLIGLALGLGAIVMPICVPYLTVFLGLSVLPGRAVLRHDLSYGVYLIHSPVIIAVTLLLQLSAGWLTALITALITLILAYLSWTVVERPALKQKDAISGWVSVQVRRAFGQGLFGQRLPVPGLQTNQPSANDPE